ncbi:LTA synthase family protein [Helicobacter sp. MIT 14-3879]|uniref:LTA synthase family protein n=1 Tax=Helicobacter sp. MIT 14-3879 TaxID=2040649 RepID=UPI000E1F1379|nr:LTA synthase family protein [Helicobacter sp. MIT 14-3879]RDU64706.1 hypothetical protein CQA44_03055 [Helicobacter sp. MIT 14-3879]
MIKDSWVRVVIFALIISFSSFIIMIAIWVRKTFGDVSSEQLVFALSFPLMQTDDRIMFSFLKRVFVAFWVFFLIIAIWLFNKYKETLKPLIKRFFYLLLTHKIKLSCCFFILSLIIANQKLHILDILNMQSKTYSNFYEEHYTFLNTLDDPHKKRNLILITAESMESTYYNMGGGGDYLIPNLYNLTQKHINFSSTNNIGGFKQVGSTGWTIAGMIAQQCGIPLRIPIGGNDFTFSKTFLKNITCLSDILKSKNYKQLIIMGSDSTFAGKNHFFNTHNIEVRDINYFKKHKLLPKDYKVNWGFEDKKVFEFAKQFLQTNAQYPFALQILTANTHSPGYSDANCNITQNVYKNSIICSDKEIYEFISWVKKQDFYKNTTIVLLGDHLTMQQNFFDEGTNNREVFNVFINTAWKNKNVERIKNRKFSHFDMFPTILSALGFNVNKIGLGVNLMSKEKTLIEALGEDDLNTNLNLNSRLYESFWLD